MRPHFALLPRPKLLAARASAFRLLAAGLAPAPADPPPVGECRQLRRHHDHIKPRAGRHGCSRAGRGRLGGCGPWAAASVTGRCQCQVPLLPATVT
jgi:hypothetical protein